MSWISDVREEISELDLSVKNLRKFALTVGPIFLLIAAWCVWKHHLTTTVVLACVGLALVIAGGVLPQSLRGVYQVWMGFSFAVGWVVSRVIITIMFYLAVTPVGLLARAVGKDFLDINMRRRHDSYWVKKDSGKTVNYERLH
jgi:hypothetical protein